MGIKSTRCMTRDALISHIQYRLSQLDNFDDMTDTELENWAEELDEKAGDIFTNYLIVDEETAKKENKWF